MRRPPNEREAPQSRGLSCSVPGVCSPGPRPGGSARSSGGCAGHRGDLRRVALGGEGSQRSRRSPRGACGRGSSRAAEAGRAGRASPCACARGTGADARRRRAPRASASRKLLASEMLRSITVHTRSWSRDAEVHADLVEERPRRAGEVAAVVGEPANRGLAAVQDLLLVRASGGIARILDHVRPQFPIDRATEPVHLASVLLELVSVPCPRLVHELGGGWRQEAGVSQRSWKNKGLLLTYRLSTSLV